MGVCESEEALPQNVSRCPDPEYWVFGVGLTFSLHATRPLLFDERHTLGHMGTFVFPSQWKQDLRRRSRIEEVYHMNRGHRTSQLDGIIVNTEKKKDSCCRNETRSSILDSDDVQLSRVDLLSSNDQLGGLLDDRWYAVDDCGLTSLIGRFAPGTWARDFPRLPPR